jgi:hypothetical protein
MWQAFFIFIFFSTWHTAGQLYLIIPYKAINANDAQVLYNASCCSLEKRLAPPLRDVASGKLYLEKKERKKSGKFARRHQLCATWARLINAKTFWGERSAV